MSTTSTIRITIQSLARIGLGEGTDIGHTTAIIKFISSEGNELHRECITGKVTGSFCLDELSVPGHFDHIEVEWPKPYMLASCRDELVAYAYVSVYDKEGSSTERFLVEINEVNKPPLADLIDYTLDSTSNGATLIHPSLLDTIRRTSAIEVPPRRVGAEFGYLVLALIGWTGFLSVLIWGVPS